MREITHPVSVSWIGDSGSVLTWHRYSHGFTFALSNAPGALPMPVLSEPWAAGTDSLAEARKLARDFFTAVYHTEPYTEERRRCRYCRRSFDPGAQAACAEAPVSVYYHGSTAGGA